MFNNDVFHDIVSVRNVMMFVRTMHPMYGVNLLRSGLYDAAPLLHQLFHKCLVIMQGSVVSVSVSVSVCE